MGPAASSVSRRQWTLSSRPFRALRCRGQHAARTPSTGLFGSGVVGETHFGILDNHVPFIEDPLSRRLTLLHSYVVYAKLLIWPMQLSCDYTYDAIPLLQVCEKKTGFCQTGVSC